MKNEAAEHVDKCLTCQKVKAEHQRPVGQLRPLEIPHFEVGFNLNGLCYGFTPFFLEEECYLDHS